MKKTFLAAFCVVGFLLITGGVILEERPNPVLINGKPFANAFLINGVIAISAADFAKAFSGTPNLQQAGFQLKGTTLATMGNFESPTNQASLGNFESPRDPASGMPTGKRMHKPFSIAKAADVSSNIFMKGGKAFIPLADVVKAFGGVFTIQGNLKPGESINLNFAPNPNAVLAIGQ